MITQETDRSLISGETGIVHVPIARAAAMEHTARKRQWNALTIRQLAYAGQRPCALGFETNPIVPSGHVAIQISWRQRAHNDVLGVPRTFHEEADRTFQKAKLFWYAISVFQTMMHARTHSDRALS